MAKRPTTKTSESPKKKTAKRPTNSTSTKTHRRANSKESTGTPAQIEPTEVNVKLSEECMHTLYVCGFDSKNDYENVSKKSELPGGEILHQIELNEDQLKNPEALKSKLQEKLKELTKSNPNVNGFGFCIVVENKNHPNLPKSVHWLFCIGKDDDSIIPDTSGRQSSPSKPGVFERLASWWGKKKKTEPKKESSEVKKGKVKIKVLKAGFKFKGKTYTGDINEPLELNNLNNNDKLKLYGLDQIFDSELENFTLTNTSYKKNPNILRIAKTGSFETILPYGEYELKCPDISLKSEGKEYTLVKTTFNFPLDKPELIVFFIAKEKGTSASNDAKDNPKSKSKSSGFFPSFRKKKLPGDGESSLGIRLICLPYDSYTTGDQTESGRINKNPDDTKLSKNKPELKREVDIVIRYNKEGVDYKYKLKTDGTLDLSGLREGDYEVICKSFKEENTLGVSHGIEYLIRVESISKTLKKDKKGLVVFLADSPFGTIKVKLIKLPFGDYTTGDQPEFDRINNLSLQEKQKLLETKSGFNGEAVNDNIYLLDSDRNKVLRHAKIDKKGIVEFKDVNYGKYKLQCLRFSDKKDIGYIVTVSETVFELKSKTEIKVFLAETKKVMQVTDSSISKLIPQTNMGIPPLGKIKLVVITIPFEEYYKGDDNELKNIESRINSNVPGNESIRAELINRLQSYTDEIKNKSFEINFTVTFNKITSKFTAKNSVVLELLVYEGEIIIKVEDFKIDGINYHVYDGVKRIIKLSDFGGSIYLFAVPILPIKLEVHAIVFPFKYKGNTYSSTNEIDTLLIEKKFLNNDPDLMLAIRNQAKISKKIKFYYIANIIPPFNRSLYTHERLSSSNHELKKEMEGWHLETDNLYLCSENRKHLLYSEDIKIGNVHYKGKPKEFSITTKDSSRRVLFFFMPTGAPKDKLYEMDTLHFQTLKNLKSKLRTDLVEVYSDLHDIERIIESELHSGGKSSEIKLSWLKNGQKVLPPLKKLLEHLNSIDSDIKNIKKEHTYSLPYSELLRDIRIVQYIITAIENKNLEVLNQYTLLSFRQIIDNTKTIIKELEKIISQNKRNLSSIFVNQPKT